MRARVTVAAAAFMLTAALVGSRALAADLPQVTDAVPGHPGVTYVDLLRQVVPDLEANAANNDIEGHLPAPLKHIAGKDFEGDPPDPVVAESFLEFRKLRLAGKPRLLLLQDLGTDPDRAYDTAVLALYDDDPATPKLLDAVDVGVDRMTAFAEPSVLDLGGGESALVTLSEHLNSDQAYDSWLLILPRGDRLRLIDDIFLMTESGCGYSRREKPTFATRHDPASPYAEIVVSVTETLAREGDVDCEPAPPKPYSRLWRTVYRWDAKAGRYVDRAHGLDRLQKLNQGRL